MGKGFQVEEGIVEQTLGLRISGEQNLKSAVEQETINLIGTNAASNAIGGFKNLKADAFFVKLARAGKTGQTCPNDKNIRAGRHSSLHLEGMKKGGPRHAGRTNILRQKKEGAQGQAHLSGEAKVT